MVDAPTVAGVQDAAWPPRPRARGERGADNDRRDARSLGGPQALGASQAIYDYTFPSVCSADGHTFAEYLEGGDALSWGSQLASVVSSSDSRVASSGRSSRFSACI